MHRTLASISCREDRTTAPAKQSGRARQRTSRRPLADYLWTRQGTQPKLPGHRCGDGEPACTPDSVPAPLGAGGGHPSRPAVARRLERPTRGCLRAGRSPPVWPCSGWGLHSRPGHPGRWCALAAPFHPCLCRPVSRPAIGGLLSVALSCGSPRLGVTQHPALWSPDVPRHGRSRDAAARPARHRPAIVALVGGTAPAEPLRRGDDCAASWRSAPRRVPHRVPRLSAPRHAGRVMRVGRSPRPAPRRG